MNKNSEIVLLKNVESEFIDKVIIILNEKNKNAAPEEEIIRQAERVVENYVRKHYSIQRFKKLGMLLSFSLVILTVIASAAFIYSLIS